MQGIRYMLLGIGIMMLGNCFLNMDRVVGVTYVFYVIGFLLILQGFHLANPKNASFNEKKIGIVKPGKEYGTVEVREAYYDSAAYRYKYSGNKTYRYDISPNCVLKMFTMGSSYSHSNVPYEWWKNQEEEKIYCIGIDKNIIVYLEEINEAFEL